MAKLLGLGNPNINSGISSKDYADSYISRNFKNAIIGGDFSTNPWQRGTSFDTSNGYKADRWQYGRASVGSPQHTFSKSTDVPTTAQAGFVVTHSFLADCSVSASIAADTANTIEQRIEGYIWAKLAQKPTTLSFWVKATKTGIYSVAMTNSGGDRTIVKEYTVNSTNTWEKKIVNFAASPSAGTWNYTTGIGVNLIFTLAAGSNATTSTLDSWESSGDFASTNQVNSGDSTSNDFRLALIQLEEGDVATEFEQLSIMDVDLLCKRYYFRYSENNRDNTSENKFKSLASGFINSTVRSYFVFQYPITMRATPSFGSSNATNNYYQNRGPGDISMSTINVTAQTQTHAILYADNGAGTNTAGQPTILSLYGANSGWFEFAAEL